MTTDERIENLEKGLASARRFNRWLLAAVGLALGVWILAGTFGPTMAAAPAGGGAVKEVRANRFVVEDANGKVRARLEAHDDGAGLFLLDENGKPRAGLSAFFNEPSLTLINGNQNVGLYVGKNGPRLGLSDENGETRALLSMDKAGPRLALYDENGKPIWHAP